VLPCCTICRPRWATAEQCGLQEAEGASQDDASPSCTGVCQGAHQHDLSSLSLSQLASGRMGGLICIPGTAGQLPASEARTSWRQASIGCTLLLENCR
jgi:hypothetical protein